MRWYKLLYVFGVLCASFLLFSSSAYAAPATFTVTNTDDSGPGSLRQAIIDANENANPSDMDRVEFNIPGGGVKTITPQYLLPSVTEKLSIDGYTQPGAVQNTAVAPNPLNNVILIELDLGSMADIDKFTISANGSEIRGLALFSDRVGKILNVNANDFVFQGNYNGFRADGMTHVEAEIDFNAGQALSLMLLGDPYSGCVIGGVAPEDRNIFGIQPGSLAAGTVTTHSNCALKGNYFGLAKDGVTTFSRDIGQFTNPLEGSNALGIGGSGNIVGGSEEGATNIITGSETAQFIVGEGSNHRIQGNYIGTDYTGQVNQSIVNGMGLLLVSSTSDSLVGGTNPGEGNIIAGVSGVGVGIMEQELQPLAFSATPVNIAVLGNTIAGVKVLSFQSAGRINYALDLFKNVLTSFDPFNAFLADQGPTPNDTSDSDTGPNGYINSPVLKSAQQIGNQLTITYDLDAADSPTDDYRVEFFANSEATIFGTGPGEEYLGAATSVTPGTNRTVTLTVSGDYYQKALSATTTAIDAGTASGFGSTSEFAQNIGIGNGVDLKADGVLDSIEISFPEAPSGGGFAGDGNGDGTPDAEQSNVTTYLIAGIGDGTNDPIFTTFEANGCASTANVTDDAATALPVPDTGYEYPFGVVSFTLNCSRGASATILKYYFTDRDASSLTLRKYKPGSQEFVTMPATITNETVAGRPAIKISYSITDGGEYDDDGEENGVIMDPVGLAASTSGGASSGGTNSALADTGENLALLLLGAGTLVTGGVWLSRKAFKK